MMGDGRQMLDRRIERGAGELVRARRGVLMLDELPEGGRPHSLAEGYAMQRTAAAAWPDTVAGWKIGATAQSVQKLFGISEPIYGPVFRQTVFPSPASLRADDFQHLLLEAEFAFLFGTALAPAGRRRSREEILAAIKAAVPAIEIVSPRFRSLPSDRVPQLVADFSANGGAVLGRAFTDWTSIDFSARPVVLSSNGSVCRQGTGALALGNPLNAVDWLVNTFAAHAIAIEAGQFVLTGTVTGIYPAQRGESLIADFGDLGMVEVAFQP
jgi:2-keto-4-pentenoate hydratase